MDEAVFEETTALGCLASLLEDIPEGSIVGMNFSCSHDSSVVVVDPTGQVVSAVSLERISRVKQDGRWPTQILESIPWSRVKHVALAESQRYAPDPLDQSAFCACELRQPLRGDRSFPEEFGKQLAKLEKPIVYVPHHLAHAASSFWASGHEEALCIVYDGGQANEHWFGGVFSASRTSGVSIVDRFSAARYGNVASLYAVVTAVLGFRPFKHEGKLTGLAALGKVDPHVLETLQSWLVEPRPTHPLIRWFDQYDPATPPRVGVSPRDRRRLRDCLNPASAEDIAATLQHVTESHVREIVTGVLKAHGGIRNICLAGGLFANVRLNQRVAEFDIDRLFVCPAMSDDGAALGAAWQSLYAHEKIAGEPVRHVFLGPRILDDEEALLRKLEIAYSRPPDLARVVAERLAQGEVVAFARGAAEFGPRALGNRSILASPRDKGVNARLNEKLSRTEFMPFAPIVREEDTAPYFVVSEAVREALKYMTVTVPCTEKAHIECPAVVHVDGTARPQLVSARTTPFLHRVLSEVSALTGVGVLVNTSFNIHEEPIVTSADDALRSFFEAGLDYLALGDCLVSRQENVVAEIRYLRASAARSGQRNKATKAKLEDASFQILDLELKQKEREILEEWVERKKSSSLWKLFSPLANLEWGLKNHVRAWKRGPTLARTSPKNGD
jgi:carbamoyltransferase